MKHSQTQNSRNEDILYGLELINRELLVFINKFKLRKFMSEEDIQDMRSGCIIEVIQAIDRFDKSKGIKLITFLTPRISGYFKDYLKKENKLKYISIDDIIEIILPKIDKVFQYDEPSINEYLSSIDPDNFNVEDVYMDLSKIEKDLSEQIITSLQAMPNVKSYVILSYYILENSIKEISDELGVSPSSGWVHKLKKRSIEMLRKKLKNKGVSL